MLKNKKLTDWMKKIFLFCQIFWNIWSYLWVRLREVHVSFTLWIYEKATMFFDHFVCRKREHVSSHTKMVKQEHVFWLSVPIIKATMFHATRFVLNKCMYFRGLVYDKEDYVFLALFVEKDDYVSIYWI